MSSPLLGGSTTAQPFLCIYTFENRQETLCILILRFTLLCFYFVWVYVYVWVSHECTTALGDRRDWIPRAGDTVVVSSPCDCCELNSGLLVEQCLPLTSEPSLQCHYCHVCYCLMAQRMGYLIWGVFDIIFIVF